MANPQSNRTMANPWPRMALAAALTVWAGANMWSAIFRWQEIIAPDPLNRFVGLSLTILFTVVPLVVAIYLVWTIVVGPEDSRYNRNARTAEPAGKKQSRTSKK